MHLGCKRAFKQLRVNYFSLPLIITKIVLIMNKQEFLKTYSIVFNWNFQILGLLPFQTN